MSTYRNQHTVPQGSLRFFTKGHLGHFFQYLKDPKHKKITPANVSTATAVDYYYNVDADDPTIHPKTIGKALLALPKQHIEVNAFRNVEVNWGALIQMFIAYQKYISREEAYLICTAYVLQKLRVQYMRDYLNKPDFKEETIEDASTKIKQKYQSMFPHHATAIENTVASFREEYLNVDSKNHLLYSLHQIAEGTHEVFNNVLHNLSMFDIAILCAPPNHYFFTSDNPGYTLLNDLSVRNMRFANDIAEIVIPINSQQAIVFANPLPIRAIYDLRRISYITIDVVKITRINELTAFYSTNAFYCEDRDYLTTFCQERKILL